MARGYLIWATPNVLSMFNTHYVAYEYWDKVQKLRDYARPRIAIQSDREQWQKNLKELNALIEKSGGEHALDARRP